MPKTSDFVLISIPELKQRILNINKDIDNLSSLHQQFLEEKEEIRRLEKKESNISNKLWEIRERRLKLVYFPRQSFIDWWKGKHQEPLPRKLEFIPEIDVLKSRESQLQNDLEKLTSEIKKVRHNIRLHWELETRFYTRQRELLSIERALKAALKIANAREEKERKLKTEINKHKAFSAVYKGKTRDLGEAIKRQIVIQLKQYPKCPYCSGKIADFPHADHIYPVSKGGLSTKENMVFICRDCNIKKGSLTLREFIKKYGLEGDKIEAILEKLGKVF